jgi:3' terminal RNA ribose 2'-O-methyltransferase Hen1
LTGAQTVAYDFAMLLTITTTATPATDLGYLLHKHPDRVQSVEVSFGQAHLFFPEATPERCTAALLLSVDAVGLVRGGPQRSGLEAYVNDKPYIAASLMSVAISRVFGSAISGASKERQALADSTIPLEFRLCAVSARGGAKLIRSLFEPIGYHVEVTGALLDSHNPQWGDSRYFDVTLRCAKRLSDALSEIYVLLPVLDNDKHYWVSWDEVEKLIRHGEGWLETHPQKDFIARRYLRHQKSLTDEALSRLLSDEGAEEDAERTTPDNATHEAQLEANLTLNEIRLDAVVVALKQNGATRVLDLGCGEGKLLRELLKEKQFSEIVGLDVSHRSLEIASERLRVERMSEKQRARLKLLHGSLTYRDKRLDGYDAAACVEVIEHLDADRLSAFERVLFECAHPKTIVLTTPNAEYNVMFENLPTGKMRHSDHRFEWTRAQFQSWARGVATRCAYSVEFFDVGPVDETLGAATQMGVFQA